MKRSWHMMLISLILLAMVGNIGCGSKPEEKQSALSRIREAGSIRVGTCPDYPPFENVDDKGNIVGFDIDLVTAIAEKIGVKVEVMGMGFDSIIIAVKNGQLDIGMSSFSVNEERKASIDFSVPYMVSSQVVLVGKDSSIKSVEELSGKQVAVAIGTTGAEAAKSIEGATIVNVDDSNISVMMLENGTVQAVVIDVAIAREYAARRGFKILEHPLQYEETAVVIGKGNDTLKAEIDKAILALKQDGTFEKLKRKWNI